MITDGPVTCNCFTVFASSNDDRFAWVGLGKEFVVNIESPKHKADAYTSISNTIKRTEKLFFQFFTTDIKTRTYNIIKIHHVFRFFNSMKKTRRIFFF